MARKKKMEEKTEEYEFVPPTFDEKAFLIKDIIGTKALMVTTLMAIIFGILASVVGQSVDQALGFLVLIIGGVALNYITPLFKIKREDLDKKTIAGNIALYVLLSLGIWILLMNPPFI